MPIYSCFEDCLYYAVRHTWLIIRYFIQPAFQQILKRFQNFSTHLKHHNILKLLYAAAVKPKIHNTMVTSVGSMVQQIPSVTDDISSEQ